MTSAFDQFTIDLPALDRQKAELRKGLLQDQREAIKETGREAEKALEAATAAAGLGRLAKAWNMRVYPKAQLANEPTALIYPKGGSRTRGAFRSLTQDTRIRARDGMLAIPLPAAALSARDRRPTPEQWELATGIKLIAVQRPGRPTLLVAQGVRVLAKSGRVKAASDSAIQRGRFASAPIFVLVPDVQTRGRFSIERTVAPYRQRLKDNFLRRANLRS